MLFGCGKLGRVSECRAIAKAVNPVLEEIERTVKPDSASAYRKASQAYGALEADLRTRTLSSAAGQQILTEYADLFAEVTPALVAYADALEQKQEPQVVANRRNLERIQRREPVLIKRLDLYCQGR